MNFDKVTVGYAFTGSFCTIEASIKSLRELKKLNASIVPIVSESVAYTDTRFGSAHDTLKEIEEITGEKCIKTIQTAEPAGPKKLFDVMIIAPCTGNTLSKLANAITDTAVTMAAKAHLRNGRPLVIAMSTNDGLSSNAKNWAKLLNTKNVFFVPFGQDDPIEKSASLIADFTKINMTLEQALQRRQLQPLLL